MSRLVPDFNPIQNSSIHCFRPNSAIQAEAPVAEAPASLEQLKETIRKFSLNFKPEDVKKYKLANITAKTCRNNRDIVHHWELVRDFFIQAMNNVSGGRDIDISGTIEQLKSVSMSQFSKEPVDNTVFLVYLLGILEGLL